MQDIFSQIATRDAAAPKPVFKTVRLWQVSLGDGRVASRLYKHGRARKIAARYNRLTGSARAYVAGPVKARLQVA